MRNPKSRKKRDDAASSLKSVEERSRSRTGRKSAPRDDEFSGRGRSLYGKPPRKGRGNDEFHGERRGGESFRFADRRDSRRDDSGRPQSSRPRYTLTKDGLFCLASETGVDLLSRTAGAEPLATMKYADELAAKESSFRDYWVRACGGEGKVLPVIGSPRARGYRTTSKRRAHPGRRVLLRADEGNRFAEGCLLEPKEHAAIFASIESFINEPINREISKRLNFAVIRGDYEHFCVIFNVDALNAAVVKGYTKTAERLAAAYPGVTSAFLYYDPTRSKYYFDSTLPTDELRVKRLFGPKFLSAEAGGIEYSFAPTAFSQVNLSIAGKMLEAARDLLAPQKGARLFDLYCGYGFFSCFLAPLFDDVIGADYERSSIDSAQHNASKLRTGTRFTFHARKIDRRELENILPNTGKPEYILLDPPRNGCAAGVIETLASRAPVRVLHVFCGIDTIPRELKTWASKGYCPVKVQPLDMFPGTPNLEVMVLLEKKVVWRKR